MVVKRLHLSMDDELYEELIQALGWHVAQTKRRLNVSAYIREALRERIKKDRGEHYQSIAMAGDYGRPAHDDIPAWALEGVREDGTVPGPPPLVDDLSE